MNKRQFFLVTSLFLGLGFHAQSQRLYDENSIGWYNTVAVLKVAPKWDIHAEYSFRRTETITNWQQSLARTGVIYTPNKSVSFMLGYGYIQLFSYGDYPITKEDFQPEHRVFEQAVIKSSIGKLDITHRYRLEQRWLARKANGIIEGWNNVNRVRYQIRALLPLQGATLDNKEFYLSASDEIFIGFGEKVLENVFDQNRFIATLGYKFSPKVRVELGYMNQILLQPREVNGQNVFQNNSGINMNLFLNFDFTKPKK